MPTVWYVLQQRHTAWSNVLNFDKVPESVMLETQEWKKKKKANK